MHAVIGHISAHQNAGYLGIIHPGAIERGIGIHLHLAVFIQHQQPAAQFAARGGQLGVQLLRIPLGKQGGDAHSQAFDAGAVRANTLLKEIFAHHIGERICHNGKGQTHNEQERQDNLPAKAEYLVVSPYQ